MSWRVKVAMYAWTEHPEYTPDVEAVRYSNEKEYQGSGRHRISEIVEIELVSRSVEQATGDALAAIGKLRREQVTEHIQKMQALNEIEAKYLCLTHESSERSEPQELYAPADDVFDRMKAIDEDLPF